MCFTKTAQFPFSVWLPLAIEAPTPVSALVHSSTLVIAGWVLILKLNSLVVWNWFRYLILIFRFVVRGRLNLEENDIKKSVALSTLRQIAFIGLAILMGAHFLAFLHIIFHAIFKSCLFINVGIIIHATASSQNSHLSFGIKSYRILNTWLLYMSRLNLLGWPFILGFYSKELIAEQGAKIFHVWTFFLWNLSIFITILYTARFIKLIFILEQQNINYSIKNQNTFLLLIGVNIIYSLSLSLLSILQGEFILDTSEITNWIWRFSFFVVWRISLKKGLSRFVFKYFKFKFALVLISWNIQANKLYTETS